MKEQEKNYRYWQNIEGNGFDTHGSYMIASGDNEYAQLRSILANYIRNGDAILDVGCACGDNLEWWEKLGKKFTYKGVDYAENFTKANRERRPEIAWDTMDARKLEEQDGSYNSVVLYDVLDALEGWEKAIDEAIRVAKDTVMVVMWMDADMAGKRKYMEEKGLNVIKIEIEGHGIHWHQFLIGRKS